jgi:hypothetical protein
MRPKLSLSSLRSSRWYEFILRFVLGGAATVLAGAIGSHFGQSAGGLFLAFPAILCASATLIESHEIRRKRQAGLKGERRGRQAAAVDAAGAALGSFGLLAFAVGFSWLVQRNVPLAFVVALVAWAAVSISVWWIWRHIRMARRLAMMHGAPQSASRRLP